MIEHGLFQPLYQVPPLLLSLCLLLFLVAVTELGHRRGLAIFRRRSGDEAAPAIGAIQGAVLGLLGLLLAFTYSYVASRADNRRAAVVEEANAIGTAYLRCDLVPEPQSGQMRRALREYCALRIVPEHMTLRSETLAAALRRSEALQVEFWSAAVTGVERRAPRPTDGLVISAMNDVIDMHGRRLAAARDRLPGVILAMLILVAGVSMVLTGHSSGTSGRRYALLNWTLAIIVSGVVYVIIDIDHPRSGLIQISQASLEETLRGMNASPATQPAAVGVAPGGH